VHGKAFLVVLVCGCGARTALPEEEEPSVDASLNDATNDATRDAIADAGRDTGRDVAPPVRAPGCADGTREAFLDVMRFATIAACSGGFTQPGVLAVLPPSCARNAGNDSANPSGTGCTVTDLCDSGWHVCTGASDVASRLGSSSCTPDAPPGTFFVTRQSGPGCLFCSTGNDPSCNQESCRANCLQTLSTTNDIFGCGTIGSSTTSSCGVLDRSGDNFCSQLPAPWSCPGNGENECITVTKPGSSAGGALCCKD
jgi:hypothetical protein